MRKGELQQVAPPQELYDQPVNLFVGGFIGSPAMNVLEGELRRSNGGISMSLGDQVLELDAKVLDARPGLRAFEGKPVIIGIRPEDLEDATLASDTAQGARFKGEVELTEALGSEVMVHFHVDARPAVTEETRELAQDRGDATEAPADGGGATLVGRFGARTRLRKGDAAEVAVDTRNLHFFDPESGLGIYDGKESVG
jgi:multiple sugar transport system ATP-binding protein